MQYRYIKQMVLVGVTLMMLGCGGGGKGSTLSYFMLTPQDTAVVTTPQPTFKLERNTNNTSSALACDASNTDINFAKLQVIKIDPQTADATVVIEETLSMPNDCQYSISFPSLTLEENTPYAWHVGEIDEELGEDSNWDGFIYSTQNMGIEDSDPHACEKNMVQDWTFLEPKTSWRTTDTSNFSSNIPASIAQQGHDDNGSATLITPTPLIYQTLSQPIVQGRYYQLKLSLKHAGKSDFQIKALAFNGTLDSLQPDSNTSIIGLTGTITNQNSWVKITLNSWKANKDFTHLAIALINDQNQTVYAQIDRVCLTEVTDAGCGDTYDVENPSIDINAPDGTITPFDYVVGTVADLYPEYDTSVSNWYGETNNTAMECATIGDGVLTGEQEGIIAGLEAAYNDAEDNRTVNDTFIQEQNITTDTSNDTDMTAIGSSYFEKCTQRIVDTSKPFSGRDIVYVHGLQRDVIKARKKKNNHDFEGTWPQDRADFYRGGEYHIKSSNYWHDHISEMLYSGNASDPSNSYLVVTWPTAQRLPYAINAVMHQIRDAMKNNNSGVIFSKNGQNQDQCFGDNGIVFVSHSTGGMVVSTMFGLMERDKNDQNSIYHSDEHFRDSLDLHVAINPAIGGSAVATAGLTTDHNSHFNPSNSVMADLGIPHIVEYWQSIMERGTKPTLLLIGGMTGPERELPEDVKRTIGGALLRGYKDGVVPSWSQSANKESLPSYTVQNSLKLVDLGNHPLRSATVLAQSSLSAPSGTRRYFVNPYLSPMGMYQNDSVASAQYGYLKNHYPFIQVAGDHFDNVDRIRRNGKHSYNIIANPPYNNREESKVTHRDDAGESVFTLGLVSPRYDTQQIESVRGVWFGFYFPRLRWVYKEIRIPLLFGGYIKAGMHVPRVTWHYKEIVIWKRTYHLLNGYEHKRGTDYIYQYILRP